MSRVNWPFIVIAGIFLFGFQGRWAWADEQPSTRPLPSSRPTSLPKSPKMKPLPTSESTQKFLVEVGRPPQSLRAKPLGQGSTTRRAVSLPTLGFPPLRGFSSVVSRRSPPRSRPTTQTIRTHPSGLLTQPYLPTPVSHDNELIRKTLAWQKRLQRVLWTHGRTPKNPWLLSHTLLAYGRDIQLPNGTSAIHHLFAKFLAFQPDKGRVIPYFPRQKGSILINPHRFLQTHILTQIRTPMQRKFAAQQRMVSLQQVWEGMLARFPSHIQEHNIGEIAWALQAIQGRLPLSKWRWTNAKGVQISLLQLVWMLFRKVEKETQFLEQQRRLGNRILMKRRQPLFREACGGFHLLQAALGWMHHPLFRNTTKRRFQHQVALLFYRVRAESAFYRWGLSQAQKRAEIQLLFRLQQQKFLGHWMETVGLLRRQGWKPNRSQRIQIQRTLRGWFVVIQALQHANAFQQLPNAVSHHQAHLDLLGDLAHTLRALQLLLASDWLAFS